MKKTFQNKPLLIAAILIVLFKIIAIIANGLSQPQSVLLWFTLPSLTYLIVAAISFSKAFWLFGLIIGLLTVGGFAQLISLLLLTINRWGARVATIVLIVCCIPDMLIQFLYIPSMPLLAIGLAYNIASIVLLVLLRRSRHKAPTDPTIEPTTA